MDVRKVFDNMMIDRVRTALKVNFKVAQEVVDYFKANYPAEYEKQLNEFFDEIHPY